MVRTTRLALGLILLAVSAAALRGEPATEPKVTLQNIKYDELTQVIRGFKGKVVVVDFWGDFCVPCKKEFPHLVELHQKYARDGLVAVSVSVDNPANKEARESALKFLQRQRATFNNYLLDEQPEVWMARLKIDAVPCVYVLNRDNQIVKKLPAGEKEPVDYKVIEQVVVEWLKK